MLKAYGAMVAEEEGLVTGLLLPDAPVVAWWPGAAPDNASRSALGAMAARRITDAATQDDPREFLDHLADSYAPGDTDFSWTRLTLWRAQLAAVLDQPPYEPITSVEVRGASDSPSTTLLAAWLQLQLQVPTTCVLTPASIGGPGHPRRHDGHGPAASSTSADPQAESPPCGSRISPSMTSHCPGVVCATASPKNCAGSIPTIYTAT